MLSHSGILRIFPAIAFAAVLGSGSAFAEDPPWTCEDPGNLPQQGMNYCAGLGFQEADRELNAVWKEVRPKMRQQDEDLREYAPELVGAEEALLKGQRAWIDYRDGTCEAMGFQARGGTLEPLIVASCKADLTRKRTEELKTMILEY